MKNFTHARKQPSVGIRPLGMAILILIGCFVFNSLHAQDKTVTGKVIDENGESIPGASVLVKGTTKGVATDINGEFTLNLSESENELEVSFIGYNQKEVKVDNQSNITISLSSEETALSEVVVTALGVKRDERALGYTVQQVDTRGLDEAKETNIVNSLTGKIAGVQISNSSGNI